MNKKKDWDHNVEGVAVEDPVDCVCRDEVVQELNEVKQEKPLDLQIYHWS